MRKDGGWVFISHSHLDIIIVRKIRNRLEECGFEPLLFYLKCLNDDDEIETLIQREINEREWFIYVDSENAARSHWVQSERAYIAKLSGKKVFTIDSQSDIIKQTDRIARQMKVFISYVNKDRKVFEILKEALVSREYLVFDPEEMKLGESWLSQIEKDVEQAVREGFVLLLVSETSANSHAVKREIERTKAAGGRIVPIFIGDAALNDTWGTDVRELQGVHLDREPTQEQIEAVLSFIERSIVY